MDTPFTVVKTALDMLCTVFLKGVLFWWLSLSNTFVNIFLIFKKLCQGCVPGYCNPIYS